MKKAEQAPAFNLRMSAGLSAQLREAAMENNRSLNQEIVQRLKLSLITNRYRP